MTYALATLGSLTALGGGLLGLLYTARRWAENYRRAPATVDASDLPPILDAEPVEVDEWTTGLELELRYHLAFNRVEEALRVGLDDTLTRFLTILKVDTVDLLEHPGFTGVRELIGAP